jgi:hypothetical protein
MSEENMKENLAALGRFAPMLSLDTFDVGQWGGGGDNEDGSMVMPHFLHGDDLLAFLDACYPVMATGFKWSEWIRTEEATHVRDHLDTASEYDLRRLVTAVVRQERFVEGMLLSAYKNGLLLKIAERAKALSET